MISRKVIIKISRLFPRFLIVTTICTDGIVTGVLFNYVGTEYIFIRISSLFP